MKDAIKILEKLLAETTVDKFPTSAEAMAARSVLVKAIAMLNEHAALKNVDSAQDYFKSQKATTNGNA